MIDVSSPLYACVEVTAVSSPWYTNAEMTGVSSSWYIHVEMTDVSSPWYTRAEMTDVLPPWYTRAKISEWDADFMRWSMSGIIFCKEKTHLKLGAPSSNFSDMTWTN